jgi:hypothetical protein
MRLGRRPMVDRRTVPITEQVSARRDEISELQLRFKLLDAQYTNDIKQLIAIEESGQFFVLREPMASHTLHLGRSTLC